MGKGFVYLDCWGKKLDFNIIKKKISMLLRSTKKCPQCSTCSASFN